MKEASIFYEETNPVSFEDAPWHKPFIGLPGRFGNRQLCCLKIDWVEGEGVSEN